MVTFKLTGVNGLTRANKLQIVGGEISCMFTQHGQIKKA